MLSSDSHWQCWHHGVCQPILILSWYWFVIPFCAFWKLPGSWNSVWGYRQTSIDSGCLGFSWAFLLTVGPAFTFVWLRNPTTPYLCRGCLVEARGPMFHHRNATMPHCVCTMGASHPKSLMVLVCHSLLRVLEAAWNLEVSLGLSSDILWLWWSWILLGLVIDSWA